MLEAIRLPFLRLRTTPIALHKSQDNVVKPLKPFILTQLCQHLWETPVCERQTGH